MTAASALTHLRRLIDALDRQGDDPVLLHKVLAENVADYRNALIALEASEQRYRTLFDRNPDGVFAVDPAGRFTIVNPACEQITGYRADELIGMAFTDLCAPDRLAETVENFRRSLGGSPEDLQTALVRKGGGRVEVLVTGGPVVVDGKVVAVHCCAKDVTARARAEAGLREAKEAAEAANAAKDQFLATVSHELRNPLNVILGWTQMMRLGMTAAEDQREATAAIEQSAQTLARLVDDLLDAARIASGKLAMEMKPAGLPQLIARAVDGARFAARSKGVRLELECHGRPDARVLGDERRLEQVLANLLNNAVKFTPGGGRVVVWWEQDDSAVRIIVSDSGIGIDPAFLPHVFDRFTQAHATGERLGGLGLGLSIVRSLVQAHGGTVTAHSEGLGRGASFTVELPLLGGPDGSGGPPPGK